MNSSNASQLFSVSSAPFWHRGKTLKWNMSLILLGLLPAAILAVLTWGLPALRVMALAVTTSVVTEALCQKMMKREIVIDNFSAVLVGLLFAFLMPAHAEWWLIVIGSFLSITMGKFAFGDLGASPLCAPVVGYVLCLISFPLQIEPNLVQLSTDFVDPLVRLRYFGIDDISNISMSSLMFGQHIGALGASQGFVLLAMGILLSLVWVIRWEIAFSFLAGFLLLGTVFYMLDPSAYANPMFHLFTGSTILSAFFLATDISSSPNRKVNMLIFGFVAGALAILIRTFGVYIDGVPFAILLANLIMPLLEGRKPKPLGME